MEVNDGFLILNKSKNCTSHDCVKRIKRILTNMKIKKCCQQGAWEHLEL